MNSNNLIPQLPDTVSVVEVGPRDGLQNEAELISLDDKFQFVQHLADAGCKVIEVGAFVRPDLVPQMADSHALIRKLLAVEGPRPSYMALVPNMKGLERALDCNIDRIAVFTAASETFAQQNIGMSVKRSLEVFGRVIAAASAARKPVRGYVSTAWWCPFVGEVDPDRVVEVVDRLFELGCAEVSVADTIGAATPVEVFSLLARLVDRHPVENLSVHFHDTRGTAAANVLAALQVGIRTIDAAAGGVGGCPFAPGATGNLATEDLLFLLHGMGIETGIDIHGVLRASLGLQEVLGRRLPSRYMRAGPQ